MASISRPPLRRRTATSVGLFSLAVVTVGAFDTTAATAGEACRDGTTSVADAPPPTERGGYVLEDGMFRVFTLEGATVGGPTDINDPGATVGGYTDAAGVQHGFLMEGVGCVTNVDFPGGPRSLNEAIGVNDRGDVVGTYGSYGDETTGEAHGYVQDRRGFSAIDVPGALVTGAFKNNDRGQVVAVYSNESRGRIGTADAHGFLLDHGDLTRIDAPGAALTFLFDINDRGQILGVGTDAENTTGFGFIRERTGRYTRLPDVPGAQLTIPLGLNNRGQVVGIYVDDGGATHGYLLEWGRVTTIDVPGATYTDAFGLNDRGQIVGAFTNDAPATVPTAERATATAADPTSIGSILSMLSEQVR